MKRQTILCLRNKTLCVYFQSVLLEEAEERDREFDNEKKKWTSGSFTYEKIQQHIADLEEERQNVTRLQEHCKGLEQREMELEHANSCLQKNLVEVQSRHKSDGEEREVCKMFVFILNIKSTYFCVLAVSLSFISRCVHFLLLTHHLIVNNNNNNNNNNIIIIIIIIIVVVVVFVLLYA